MDIVDFDEEEKGKKEKSVENDDGKGSKQSKEDEEDYDVVEDTPTSKKGSTQKKILVPLS